MLDIISGGRLDFGIGRGYQPREVETLGAAFGSTIQDQERNRAMFEETFAIIMKCWTEDSFSHHGEFFTIPPTYTRWHHRQTMAYFSDQAEGDLERCSRVGGPRRVRVERHADQLRRRPPSASSRSSRSRSRSRTRRSGSR